MAVTSLTNWDSPLLNNGCIASLSYNPPRWNSRQFPLSVLHHRRFSKVQKSCNPFQTFRFGSLRCISTVCQNNHQLLKKWQGGQTKRTQGQSRSAALTRGVQVFCIVTEKIVSGSQFSTSADQSVRRLILLRHAKSSWSDRSIKAIHDIASAAPTSKSRISKIWSKMDKSWASGLGMFLNSCPSDLDHERPLSRRGRQAAANIALKLQECAGWEPQLILCSDSTRTRETLDIMQEQLAESWEGEVRYFSSFYSVAAMDGQTVQHLQDIICRHSKDDVTTIMCMGHNRGWEEAASLLSGLNVELKTANAALLESRGSSWQEAFEKAGLGGWKLVGVVKPDHCIVEEGAVQ